MTPTNIKASGQEKAEETLRSSSSRTSRAMRLFLHVVLHSDVAKKTLEQEYQWKHLCRH